MERRHIGLLVFTCLFARLCAAQLATTDDGTQVLVSSAWRLRGETTSLDHSGVYQRSRDVWAAVVRSSGSQVAGPFLSGDGSIVGWERIFPCFGSCMFAVPRSTTEFQGLTKPVRIAPYRLVMSRNGRFILTPGFWGLSDFALQDLDSGQTWTPPAAPYLSFASGVADDGSVIGLSASRPDGITNPLVPHRVVIWRPGSDPRELMQGESVLGLWLSANGKRALVEVAGPRGDQPRELWWIDVDGGQRLRIAQQAPNGQLNFLDQTRRSLSNDGSRVLFWWPSERDRLWLWEATTGEARAVLEAAEGFSDAVLSGTGRVVWALTTGGRLLRLDLEGSGVEQVLDALPVSLSWSSGGVVPGSASILRGTGGSADLRFFLKDLEFPLVDATQKDSVAIQIPWEMAGQVTPMIGFYPLVVSREGHPFELQVGVYIEVGVRPALALRDIEAGYGLVKAALPDFSALVTEENPAAPGSTIHTWLFGLGPLDRPVPTGAPGPSDPPARPVAGVACYLRGPENQPPARGLVLPFVAYAPGLVGVYQVDITIPEDWPAGRQFLNCESAGRNTYGLLPVGAR